MNNTIITKFPTDVATEYAAISFQDGVLTINGTIITSDLLLWAKVPEGMCADIAAIQKKQ